MSFCSNCGTEVGLEDLRTSAPTGQLPAYPPGPMPYPSLPYSAYPYSYPYPYPYPYAYRLPITAKRAATIAAGIIVLIDGGLAFLLGFVMLFEFGQAIAVSLFIGFGLSIVASVSAFTCSNIYLTVVGPVVLIGAAFFVMATDWFIAIGLIGGAMAAVSLGLVIYGWSDTKMRSEMKPRRNPVPTQQYYPPYSVDPSGSGGEPEGNILNLRR